MVSSVHRDGVAVLTIDHPPVNAIGADVRAALARALDEAERAPQVRAVVIAGAGKMFSGGGDLREIGRLDPPGAVSMADLARRIETGAKPAVMAMHGKCIGGGVLLAMGCHARVASDDALLMLPELNLGLVPGAGGTQRLPRLVGVEAALDMVVRARALEAGEALRQGLLDEVGVDPVADASRRALDIAGGRLPWRRTSELPLQLAEPVRAALRNRYLAVAEQCFPGRLAAREAVDLIVSASTLAFEHGCAAERACFARLAASSQARALLYLFFAERALAKAPDAPDAATRARIAARLRAAGAAASMGSAWTAAARACLAEGWATRAEFIDVIAVKDCGYPALLGGPLHHAGQH
ncbi:MAG: enoyl-CoA hydratase/isomerase family protein [Pigmentiphaga sp.]|uniref:enoyl-CoA hydratase/isomerase family protein n=1 Tax=Pigmentiphaga sp. TaxID=1977564 RepID=UPI0029A60CB7|nr:enoyl-CoA hydratase/isomerase family protein [Pigmentiphaga sp.]MDX3907053.1 enoyl-CoA hydratase/isomerase family protein [Pigmentiphaga sp.]